MYLDVCFVWIDIEIYVDWFDDFDVENFLIILIEDVYIVCFFGMVLLYVVIVECMLFDLSVVLGVLYVLKLCDVLNVEV